MSEISFEMNWPGGLKSIGRASAGAYAYVMPGIRVKQKYGQQGWFSRYQGGQPNIGKYWHLYRRIVAQHKVDTHG